jgi:diguanylate cyclase (GGDEF)-like protein
MSLLKQLLLSVSVAITAILIGTLGLSIGAARQYLDGQLQSQSENAVSALALSLSQPANQDPVTRELLMMALFDSGQFREIRLHDPAGQVLFERTNEAIQRHVPAWFSQMLPLSQPKGVREISNGWTQVGALSVVVDNRFAVQALWLSTLKMTALIVGAGLAWAVFVGVLLRWFRRVLREEVEAQVLRIGTQQVGPHAAESSRVWELASVSSAIAQTHTRVQQTNQAQLARIDSLELETHRDPITQLPNRKYFVNELNKALHNGAQAQGQVMLVRLRDLQAMNTSMPRTEVDAWLQNMGAQVQLLLQEGAAAGATAGAQLARLNGSDFALLLPGAAGPAAMQVVQNVRALLQSMAVALVDGRWSRWAFVLTAYAQQDTIKDVLSRLDQGLMQAESAGHDEVEYAEFSHAGAQTVLAGEGHWHSVLGDALAHAQQLQIAVQSVASVSLTDTDVRHEAALQLHDAQGHILGAPLFLPAAVRLGLSAQFDVQAIQRGLYWLAEHRDQTLVVRVSVPSLENPRFLPLVQALLGSSLAVELGDALQQLVLELDAHALELVPQVTMAFAAMAARAGVGVGLRRLDQAPKALLTLSQLPLRYVKLGGYYAQQSLENAGAQYLLEAMIHTAQAQGARIYITEAPSPEAAEWLRSKGASLPVVNV